MNKIDRSTSRDARCVHRDAPIAHRIAPHEKRLFASPRVDDSADDRSPTTEPAARFISG